MTSLRTFASVIVVCGGFLGVARGDGATGEWRLTKEKHGVQVYQRKVGFSSVDEVRGEAVLDVPAEVLFRVLGDVESYPGVLPPTVVARRLKEEQGARFFYTEINPPLIQRRFYCIRSQTERRPDGALRVEWSLANELCPPTQRRMVRVEDNAGAWTLRPLDEHRTRVIYQAHTNPGGEIPAWIVNEATAGQLPDIFRALRKAADLPRYAQAQAQVTPQAAR